MTVGNAPDFSSLRGWKREDFIREYAAYLQREESSYDEKFATETARHEWDGTKGEEFGFWLHVVLIGVPALLVVGFFTWWGITAVRMGCSEAVVELLCVIGETCGIAFLGIIVVGVMGALLSNFWDWLNSEKVQKEARK